MNPSSRAATEALRQFRVIFGAVRQHFQAVEKVCGVSGAQIWAMAALHQKPGMKVSWQVTGVRKDAYAEAHRIQVEEDKPAEERGFFIFPELFGAPEEQGIAWAHHPEMMLRDKQAREAAAATR